MHLVEITPAPCLCCGQGNAQDSRDPVRFVDLERDVNWNDPAILCEDCIAKMGGLVGMMSKDSMEEFKRELKVRDQEIHRLKAEADGMKRRAKKLGIEFVPVEA